MSLDNALALAVSILLLAYLVAALVLPEKF